MTPEFSEFSFGFALTHEICGIWTGGLRAAPVFPSLIEEGRANGGHDVFIDVPGYPLFLQFKRSEYMVRSTAGEWSHFHSEYYRFWLHAPRHSDQHQLLLERDQPPNVILYAAPAFRRAEELNAAFLRRTVIHDSVFFRPRDIGALPDQDEHCVAFQPGTGFGIRCPEPKRIEIAASGAEVQDVLTSIFEGREPVQEPERYFEDLVADLEEIGRRKADIALADEAGYQRVESAHQRAAYLSRTLGRRTTLGIKKQSLDWDSG